VLDTNTLVSAVISADGPPRRLLDAARTQAFDLCSSAVLLAELLDVLSREKFSARLTQADLTPLNIVSVRMIWGRSLRSPHKTPLNFNKLGRIVQPKTAHARQV